MTLRRGTDNWISVEGGRCFTIFLFCTFWILNHSTYLLQTGFSGSRCWDGVWGTSCLLKINTCGKKERKQDWAEGQVHLLYKPDKTLANLWGALEHWWPLRAVLGWVERVFLPLPQSGIGCLWSGKGVMVGSGSSLQLRQSLTELTSWVANLILKGDRGSVSQQCHYFCYPYTLWEFGWR